MTLSGYNHHMELQMAKDGGVERVFLVWRSYRPNPTYCRLTQPRRKLLGTRLRSYTADDLCVLIKYANEADAAECRYWRGDNAQKQEYLDLTNLLRVTKLDGRLERALLWRDAQLHKSGTSDGLDLGPMGLWQ